MTANLEQFVGQYVALWCGVYIYAGKLVAISDNFVQLSDAGVVYDTGPLTGQSFRDFQRLPGGSWLASLRSIESAGLAPGHPDAR